MSEREGTLVWNAGGWFGGQVGGTVWILVAAGISAAHDIPTALILFGIFVVPNIIGTAFWMQRDRISCYAAMQVYLATMAAAGLASVFVLDHRGLWSAIQSGSSTSVRSAYGMVVLVAVGLMVMFYLRFGRRSEGDVSDRG